MTTISKALPIKFWLEGQTSYNDGIEFVSGVMSKLFVQKYLSTDPLVLQFYDTVEKDYKLKAYDIDGVLIGTVSFTRTLLNGIYIYSYFSTFFDSFGVTDEVIKLKIVEVYNAISGSLVDTMETVSGDITFTEETYSLSGSLTDTMETVSGTMVNAQSDSFGSGTTPSGACNIDLTLYWPAGVAFGTGVIMYTDPAMTTPLTGEDYISQNGVGEIFNINSATGEVEATTGTFC